MSDAVRNGPTSDRLVSPHPANWSAILIALGEHPRLPGLHEHIPIHLLPLVDRPFLQQMLESLAHQGCDQIDLVLSHLPERTEDLLGDGKRWGITIRYHLARSEPHAYRQVALVGQELAARVDPIAVPPRRAGLLVGHADRFPLHDFRQSLASIESSFLLIEPRTRKWTGWAWITFEMLQQIPSELSESLLEDWLIQRLEESPADVVFREAQDVLRLTSYSAVLESNLKALTPPWQSLGFRGREVEPGIWLSRNVSLHPSTRLVAPVYIGENCKIERGVSLGPDAIVGSGCVLDRGCHVDSSVIFPSSYIGEGLELSSVLIHRNMLINTRLDAKVLVRDDFILGQLNPWAPAQYLNGLVTQLLGCLALVLTSPLLIAAWLIARSRNRPLYHLKQVVQLPSDLDPACWRTFLLHEFAPSRAILSTPRQRCWSLVWRRLLPGLLNVARGEIRFVGVTPRSPEEISALPSDWRAVYLKAKVGVLSVTEAELEDAVNASTDDWYASEAFYAVSAGLGLDLRLLGKFAWRCLRGSPSSTSHVDPSPSGEQVAAFAEASLSPSFATMDSRL